MSVEQVTEIVAEQPSEIAINTPEPAVEESLDDKLNAQFDEITSEKPVEKAEQPPEQVKEEPIPQESIDPPVSWTKEQKEKFKALPPDVKSYIRQREDEVTKGFQQLGGFKQAVSQIQQAVAPFQERLQTIGADLPTAINRMLSWDKALSSGDEASRVAAFQALATQYGLNPEKITSPEPTYVDPDILELKKRLDNTERVLQQKQYQEQMKVRQTVETDFVKFAADQSNKYFNDVRFDMGVLIERGLANSLPEAYEKAVRLHPEISKKYWDEQRLNQMAESNKKAQSAKQAAFTNVRSNNVSGSRSAISLDDRLSEAYDTLNGK